MIETKERLFESMAEEERLLRRLQNREMTALERAIDRYTTCGKTPGGADPRRVSREKQKHLPSLVGRENSVSAG